MVSIEPATSEQEKFYLDFGFRYSKTSSLPSETIQINLKASEKQLLSEMHHKTRYNIGLAKRKGVKAKVSQEIELFAQKWQKSAKERGMWLSQKREIISIFQSFKDRSHILLAFENKDPIAGILVIHSNSVSYYMYAFSTPDGRKKHAPTFLAWEAIKLSKAEGSSIFDFEGIYDPRYPLKAWKGFTRFKKSFGGKDTEFPRPLHKFFFPF